ncbi:MAG: PAS-domain containing protein [Rhodopila sp.]|nr:PAS-domain containing protein [Rhodopila sp.]
MSDSFKRRRRGRTGSTSARFRPSQLVPVESVRPSKIGKAELAACGAVAIVAFALVALIWIVTTRAVQEQRTEIRDRAEQALIGQAATMAETIGHELLLIDQSLTIVQAAWKADSDSVDLVKWQQKMPALTAVADDIFICDEKHVIRQDILPQAVGQGVGAAYVTFPHGSLEQFESDGTKNKESLLLQGETGAPIDARQFLMYIVRPLDHPKGWLIGASYRSAELTKLFAQAALGYNPVVALVDTQRGILQAVVGPAARRPKTDVSQSALFGAMTRSPSGTWLGDTVIDGVQRIHAFHRVANRDMAVLVAANWNEVMAPADNLAAGARSLAFVGTALVLFIGGLVLWELYTIRGHRRQQRILDRNKGELERLRNDLATNAARTQLNTARLQVVLDNTADGIALFDSSLRLVQWNHPFLRGIGIEPRQEMPLDTLLREQAAAGLWGAIADTEVEIARRVGILRTGDPAGSPQSGPDHENLILRGLPIVEGGFILLLNGLSSWVPAPPPAPATEIDEPAPEPAAPTPIEW